MSKYIGGGWYQLSDGSKVHGKAKAEAAEDTTPQDSEPLSNYGNPYAKVEGAYIRADNVSVYGNPYAKVAET